MYESLAERYRILFEGLPDPVFYNCFYPMGEKDDQWLWDMFKYAQGLKLDKDQLGRWFNKFHDAYVADLKALLNAVMKRSPGRRRGVAVIPSSKRDVTNRVTQLAREVMAANPTPYRDLTRSVFRALDKQPAHSGGSRIVKDNASTLAVSDPAELSCLDVIVVLDDILTTGASFRAMDDVLRRAGFRGTVVNFAFAHTYPAEGVRNYLRQETNLTFEGVGCPPPAERTIPSKVPRMRHGYYIPLDDGRSVVTREYGIAKKAGFKKETTTTGHKRVTLDPAIRLVVDDGSPIEFTGPDEVRQCMKRISYRPQVDAVVFDFDQTLVDDSVRHVEFEGLMARGMRSIIAPYMAYDGVADFTAAGIPYAMVSNRPEYQIMWLVQSWRLQETLYPGLGAGGTGTLIPLENVFSYPTEESNGYPCKLYKPSTRGVENAKRWLLSRLGIREKDARIVGVGNTVEDMIAYNVAGLESCLALWGVPEFLRDHAANCWKADHVFSSMSEFTEWCQTDGLRHGWQESWLAQGHT